MRSHKIGCNRTKFIYQDELAPGICAPWHNIINFFQCLKSVSNKYNAPSVWRDVSVGITTRYGLDGPGIESRWEARYSASVQTGPRAHPASCTMGSGSFPGVKRSGRVVDTPSSAEVKERLEIYLYSPSGPSWPLLG